MFIVLQLLLIYSIIIYSISIIKMKLIEIEYISISIYAKHDESAKTSGGEVAGYGYGRREGPCGRLTSDPWRSPPAAARGRRHAVCERGERLSKGGLCLSLSCLMCHHRLSTHPQWL